MGCTLRGIDEQATKAGKAAAGQVPISGTPFIALGGRTREVNRELEPMGWALAAASILTRRTLPSV